MPAKRSRTDTDPDDPLAPGATAADGTIPAGRAPEADAPEGQAPESFEAALEELEEIVEQMESGELALEDSLRAYARGAVLVRYCRETLARVEQRVRVLEGEVLKPFELDADRGER